MRITYVFDLGGVLIKLNVQRCFQAFEKLMGEENMRLVLGMDNRGEGIKAVSIASNQLMANFERGMISPETFLSQVQQYCHLGTTTDEIIEAWMSMLDELPEERLAFVDSLRAKGHRIYLLSNGNELHFDFINRTYGLDSHFDGLFLSQEIVWRPSKQFIGKPSKASMRYGFINHNYKKDGLRSVFLCLLALTTNSKLKISVFSYPAEQLFEKILAYIKKMLYLCSRNRVQY